MGSLWGRILPVLATARLLFARDGGGAARAEWGLGRARWDVDTRHSHRAVRGRVVVGGGDRAGGRLCSPRRASSISPDKVRTLSALRGGRLLIAIPAGRASATAPHLAGRLLRRGAGLEDRCPPAARAAGLGGDASAECTGRALLALQQTSGVFQRVPAQRPGRPH